jgi:mono/diheme cytochrome c family protein
VAEVERQRVPMWVMPALVALPFWAILYFGAFGSHKVAEAAPPNGAALYSSNCASCHGATGEGVAQFPPLRDGEAKITFPDEADHITWVNEGSQSKAKGTPYGDPARAGGQRTVEAQGMPAFAGTLSDAEIHAVVTYEREEL